MTTPTSSSTYTLVVPPSNSKEDARLTLRVRKPKTNTNGSILLVSSRGDLWECVRCFQGNDTRYTEENWIDKYDVIYGFDEDRCREAETARNADELSFAYKRSDRLRQADQCRLSAKEPIAHDTITRFVWNATEEALEMQIAETTKATKHKLGCVEYTNLYLKFRNVMSADPEPPSKRPRV